MWDLGEYQKCGIRASNREGNIRVNTGKGRIRASIGEGKIRVSTGKGRIRESIGEGKIRVSTINVGSGRVPEMWDLDEYQKCGMPKLRL